MNEKFERDVLSSGPAENEGVKRVDLSVSATDDLFRHINGDWLRTYEIPADRGAYGSFHKLQDNAEERLLDMVDANSKYASALPLSTALYSSYMDLDAIEARSFSPVSSELKMVDGIDSIQVLEKTLVNLMPSFGILPFSFGVYSELENPEIYGMHLAQGGLSLPDKAFYFEGQYASLRDKFVRHVEKIFVLIGEGQVSAKIASEHVLDLETRIAKGHFDAAKCRDVDLNHNLMTLASLDEVVDNFKISTFFKSINCELLVDVHQVDFFRSLGKLWTTDNLKFFKYWLKYRIVVEFAAFLSTDFDDEKFNFYSRSLGGLEKKPLRWKRGVRLVNSLVGDEPGRIYADLYFSPVSRLKMAYMVANLIEAYHRSISNSTWMSQETRSAAIEKLSKFDAKIGFPRAWRKYAGVHFTKTSIVDNIKAYNRYTLDKSFADLGTQINKEEWHMSVQTVNAYYNPTDNAIVFPAAILDFPFFDPDRSDAENYGGIGAVIGHEIGHGFDDQGAKFDGDGKLRSWWQKADEAEFKKLTHMLDEQFNQFVPKQFVDSGEENPPHINGKLTTGENVGDLCGVKIALKAYAISQGYASSIELTNASRSNVQKFFTSYARIWRLKIRDEELRTRLTTDPHSPAEFRANTVRNLDAFHLAFGSQRGDGLWLEPEDRVRIW
ncbi:MAG: peptidase M13 [Candidatus Ancillula trichonymphae]|jgi:predicted metalloendopeptidase|nr:peptidase M13 [Candidatus Ancillula trichonymphae]